MYGVVLHSPRDIIYKLIQFVSCIGFGTVFSIFSQCVLKVNVMYMYFVQYLIYLLQQYVHIHFIALIHANI